MITSKRDALQALAQAQNMVDEAGARMPDLHLMSFSCVSLAVASTIVDNPIISTWLRGISLGTCVVGAVTLVYCVTLSVRADRKINAVTRFIADARKQQLDYN